jgi:site-specific DNA-methyltransferase (adenine-specific)
LEYSDVSRIEHIGDATLYLGDCLDEMRECQSFDCVITDPVWPNVPDGLIPGSNDPYGLFDAFCRSVPDNVIRLAVEMRNDSDPRFLRCVPQRLEFVQVMWCQYAMPGYLGRVLGGNETVYVFGQPIISAPGRRVIPSISPKAQPSDRPPNGHPCSRALVHQAFVVNWCSDVHETVLDPFMGSGTTGVACASLGRKFIGIEIEPKYFDIACRRIEEAYKQPRLFQDRASTPAQQSMLNGAA